MREALVPGIDVDKDGSGGPGRPDHRQRRAASTPTNGQQGGGEIAAGFTGYHIPALPGGRALLLYRRGGFVGLSLTNRKQDIYRSVLEGGMFSFRDVAENLAALGQAFRFVATSGGGAQSPLWRQIHADIFKKKVMTVSGSRGGAALIAGVGLELWPDFETACGNLTMETETLPDPRTYELYDRFFEVYRGFYPLLKPRFDSLTAVVEPQGVEPAAEPL